MRIFISTGEVSGDLQGSLLITALQQQVAPLNLEIVALGGEKMANAGATLLANTTSISSFGLLEVLPFVLPTMQIEKRAQAYLKQNPPDLLVLIDYMALNVAIGNYVRRHLPQVPIVYYIAPQLWVSSVISRDAEAIIAISDKLLAIFPQEADYFQKKGANVTWVGHPLVDRVQDFPSRQAARETLGINQDDLAIALLPASRVQEIKYLLPVMLQAAKNIQAKLPHAKFWIPLSREEYRKPIEKAICNYSLPASIVSGQQMEVLAAADLAITKCGTVNLELALLNVPQVVMYRLNPFTYWIARKILKIKFPFASPTNLMMMKSIVPEFIQEQATPENLTQAAIELLLNQEKRQQTLADYKQMRSTAGELGVCHRAAKEILQII